MQSVRLAAFVSGAGLQLVLPPGFHSRGATPLHLEWITATALHQENHMFLFWLYKAIIKPEKAKSRESHSLGVIQQSHDAKK